MQRVRFIYSPGLLREGGGITLTKQDMALDQDLGLLLVKCVVLIVHSREESVRGWRPARERSQPCRGGRECLAESMACCQASQSKLGYGKEQTRHGPPVG